MTGLKEKIAENCSQCPCKQGRKYSVIHLLMDCVFFLEERQMILWHVLKKYGIRSREMGLNLIGGLRFQDVAIAIGQYLLKTITSCARSSSS